MKTTLDQIVEYKREELLASKRRVSFKDVQSMARDQEPAQAFLKNFRKNKINIIAEIKKASPSAGVIREDFKPLDLARIYEDNGAASLSVLTDEKFFQGSLDVLRQVKDVVGLPCLRKDFAIHEYHIWEARAAGADAVLLIAAILDAHQLKDFQQLACELGMSVLFEVHDAEEVKKILPMAPKLVGVNNRNLKTFDVNLETSKTLLPQLPQSATRISESGLKTRDDLEGLIQVGFDGFLIGETLMREKDIGKKLREFISIRHPAA